VYRNTDDTFESAQQLKKQVGAEAKREGKLLGFSEQKFKGQDQFVPMDKADKPFVSFLAN